MFNALKAKPHLSADDINDFAMETRPRPPSDRRKTKRRSEYLAESATRKATRRKDNRKLSFAPPPENRKRTRDDFVIVPTPHPLIKRNPRRRYRTRAAVRAEESDATDPGLQAESPIPMDVEGPGAGWMDAASLSDSFLVALLESEPEEEERYCHLPQNSTRWRNVSDEDSEGTLTSESSHESLVMSFHAPEYQGSEDGGGSVEEGDMDCNGGWIDPEIVWIPRRRRDLVGKSSTCYGYWEV